MQGVRRRVSPTRLDARALRALRGRLRVPGDKSISHRYAMLGAIADGTSRLTGYAPDGDTLRSADTDRDHEARDHPSRPHVANILPGFRILLGSKARRS